MPTELLVDMKKGPSCCNGSRLASKEGNVGGAGAALGTAEGTLGALFAGLAVFATGGLVADSP
jgi:hypothetical protein